MLTTAFNNKILNLASKLSYSVADVAPSDERSLFNTPSLKIWSGASDNTIFGDASVNHAFRALHDALHLKAGIGFTPLEEMHLGRIQANMFDGLLSDLIYIEVSKQAEYFLQHGEFVRNQVSFTIEQLNKMNIFLK